MLSRIFAWWMRVKGWKVTEGPPADVKKCVVVAAPHTSNWDFVYALGAYRTMNIPLSYLAKKELFRFPFKFIFSGTGGIPVERSKRHNLVDTIVELFRNRKELYLIMAAEGTRKRVQQWKSGFYFTALKAQVPIMLGFLDYKKKYAGFGELFYPTGDIEKDMERIREFYLGITGKNPELFDINAVRLVTDSAISG